MRTISRPQPGEFAPYTADYIALVPADVLVLQHLADQVARTEALFRSYQAEALTRPHKTGEWTLQDVLGHIIDTERVFAYRTLRIARCDKTDLPGFEQDDYAVWAAANTRTLDSLLDEYKTVRAATLSLLHSLPDEAFTRAGTANRNPLSVRAAVYIVAGHELYHLESIRTNYPL